MEKKEINTRTTVKAIITGFVSYGIIISIICLLVFAFGSHFLNNSTGDFARGLHITIPLIAIILLYFAVHGVCNLSTYDVFKTCKTNPENYKKIVKYLNIFFIACIILSLLLFLSMLFMNLRFQIDAIEHATSQYSRIFSSEHTEELNKQMLETYNNSKINLVTSTVILEIGVMISFISLIPYQRKLIVKYNKF